MKRRYAFRFYPTAAQTRTLARVFGACRYVYNWGLRLRTDAYRLEDYPLSYGETSALLTKLKGTPEHAWLQEISCVPTQQALRHLQTAFLNFFEKRARHPSFNKKAGDQSAEYTRSAFTWDAQNRNLTLAGIGRLKVRWSRDFSSLPTTVTVMKDAAQRYFVTLCLDEEVRKLGPVHQAVGIDLGITALARALSDAGFGEFRRMLEYKCEGYGRELRRVDRFYPSSKRCFDCGHVLEELPLDCREGTCPQCGHPQDRDLNAAKNILAAGQAVTARGGKVRPKRDRIRKGASPRSANPPESLHEAS